jgi:hypothetical protein
MTSVSHACLKTKDNRPLPVRPTRTIRLRDFNTLQTECDVPAARAAVAACPIQAANAAVTLLHSNTGGCCDAAHLFIQPPMKPCSLTLGSCDLTVHSLTAHHVGLLNQTTSSLKNKTLIQPSWSTTHPLAEAGAKSAVHG